MLLDLASLGILIALAWLGARKGALAAAVGLLAIVGAYTATIFLASPVAESIKPTLNGRGYLALPLAGTLVFAAIFLLLSIAGAIASKLETARLVDGKRNLGDRTLGAVFGLARGALIVFLLGVLGLWLDAAREVDTLQSLPDLSASTTTALTSSTIESAAKIVVPSDANPTTRATVQIMAHPKASMTAMRALLEDPFVQELIRDPDFWSYIQEGNIDAALNTETFQEISRDTTTRSHFRELGLIDAKTAASEEAFGAYFHDILEEVSPRLRAIQHDPEFQDLLQDPALTAAAQTGDTFALLAHPGLQRFADRVLAGDIQAAPAATPPNNTNTLNASGAPHSTSDVSPAPTTENTPSHDEASNEPYARKRSTTFIVHDSMPPDAGTPAHNTDDTSRNP